MTNLSTSTDSAKPAMSTFKTSFQLNGSWFRVTVTNNIGVDQHGDKWFFRGGKLYSEHSFSVIAVPPVQIAEPIVEREWFTEDSLMDARDY